MDEMAAMMEDLRAAPRSESDSWAHRVRDLEVSLRHTNERAIPISVRRTGLRSQSCLPTADSRPLSVRARAAGAACIGTRSHRAAGTRLAGLPLMVLR